MPSETIMRVWKGDVAGARLIAVGAIMDTFPFGFGTGGWSIILTPMIQLSNCDGLISLSIDWLGGHIAIGIGHSK